MRILLTRPEADAARTATALRACGHDVVIAPLLDFEILPNPDLGAGSYAAILLTSANAVRAIAGHRGREELLETAAFTVGDRTAQAMRDTGFTNVTSAGGNVDDLARLVADRVKPPARLLYLAGEERSGDLAGRLRERNYEVHTALVYRAVVAASLPRHAADALAGSLDGVLHFSRRSAEAYVNAARNAGLLADALVKPIHYCLSDRIAEPLTAAGAVEIRVAARPDEAALIALLH
jgi:uroporphyrinogen-III synthase